MGDLTIKLVRLILKYGRFGLFCVVIQLDGNSKYIEYTLQFEAFLLWIWRHVHILVDVAMERDYHDALVVRRYLETLTE